MPAHALSLRAIVSVFMNSEDLLIWGSSVPDPWNRLSNNLQPFIIVVEFCQMEGPRPLIALDATGGKPNVDLDAVSLWLMSSDSAGGSMAVLFNQEMDLHALAYYCTVYDVRARAFQRAMCVACVGSVRMGKSVISRFPSLLRRLLSPLLSCNRRLFLALLAKLVALSDDFEKDLAHEYYTLYRAAIPEGSKRKIEAVTEQARKLRPRLEMMSESLRKQIDAECHGHTDCVLPEWLFQGGNAPLAPLSTLAPCSFPSFESSLVDLLACLTSEDSTGGVLYSADEPILRLSKCATPLKERLRREEERGREETLRECTHSLDQILYPVVCGDNLAICGSKQRRNTVVDIVSKLEFVRPKTHVKKSVLHFAPSSSGVESEEGVFGVECPARTLPKCKRVLDMNACQLHGVSYTGSLLSPLHRRRSFPSDESLLSFMASTLTLAASLVYLVKYIPLSAVVKEEKLSNEDQNVVSSLLSHVDFGKFSGLREETRSLPSTLPLRVINLN